jgi:hypothetical protein
VLGRRLNPFTPARPGPGIAEILGGIALIDAGYRYAAEELSKSGLAKQFMT